MVVVWGGLEKPVPDLLIPILVLISLHTSLHLPHHDSYLGLSTKLSAEKTDDKLEEEKTRGIIIF